MRTRITSNPIVLPDAKAIRGKMQATVKKDEVFVESTLAKSLSAYSGEAMSPQNFVRQLIRTIKSVTQETPSESDLQIIMLSRVPRYIDALVPVDVREAVHARFERIKGSMYT